MDFASRLATELGPVAGMVLKAILLSLLGILLLIAFIVTRRWYRGRYFRRLNERTFAVRSKWADILTGRIPAKEWRLKPLDCEIVESILLDNIEVASSDQLPALLDCLRSSGLLDMRIHQARSARGWERRTALVSLGRTRALEAIPALSEALDADTEETRTAAVRGLGRTGLPEAAVPLLDRLLAHQLSVPEHPLKNALAECCRKSPALLMRYLTQCHGKDRELIARVLAEVASADLEDDLLILAADPLPEVRASAARALAAAPPWLALPALSTLVGDSEWFVRLRAVVTLAAMQHHGRLRLLIRALCDSNRNVRQRAAWGLARLGSPLEEVLEQVIATQDNYALQAFISELERSGTIDKVVHILEGHADHHAVENVLLDALKTGRKRVEAAMGAAAGAGNR